MEKPLSEINMSVKIIEFLLEEFYLVDTLPVDIAKSLDKSRIQFEFNAGMNIDVVKKHITVNMKTNFFAEEEKKNNIGHINTKCVFEVANIEEIIGKTQGNLPNVMLASFLGITLSTTRGVLILKSEKTFMEGTIIPMMDPMGFFKSPLKIENASNK